MIRILTALLLALCLASCGADLQTRQDALTVYESATKWVYNTPESTCFSRVGYDSRNNVLIVVFRDSGAEYHYYDVPEDVWESFYDSTSLGRYFNSYIKGNYAYKKQKAGALRLLLFCFIRYMLVQTMGATAHLLCPQPAYRAYTAVCFACLANFATVPMLEPC